VNGAMSAMAKVVALTVRLTSVAGAELPREERQDRLGGVEIDEGAEAGKRDGRAALVDPHRARTFKGCPGGRRAALGRPFSARQRPVSDRDTSL
jgi:hypothetical protein